MSSTLIHAAQATGTMPEGERRHARPTRHIASLIFLRKSLTRSLPLPLYCYEKEAQKDGDESLWEAYEGDGG